jgi:hypothetical protein
MGIFAGGYGTPGVWTTVEGFVSADLEQHHITDHVEWGYRETNQTCTRP